MFQKKRVVMLSGLAALSLCVVTRADLLGYWPLEETSGAVATNLVPKPGASG